MTAMQSGVPTDILEQRAAEQRRDLHNSVNELRDALRQRMDLRRQARPYVWQASAVAGLLALGAGYLLAGAFTD